MTRIYQLLGSQGALKKKKKTPTEVGGCFFWGNFPRHTASNDPTDLSNGYQTGSAEKTASVRGIGSKWPNMGLQHAAHAREVC
jgi:hypothetical protein